MLTLVIAGEEQWDSVNNEFITAKSSILQLEHSLLSLSKWESNWQKPFISNEPKTQEETLDYIRCMTINKNVDPNVYRMITAEQVAAVNKYIGSPMTATTFSKDAQQKGGQKEIITSELIYYWMISLQIPFECQKWHLNRLLTLIRVCSVKNQPPKKMSKSNVMKQNSALNAARKRNMGTRG